MSFTTHTSGVENTLYMTKEIYCSDKMLTLVLCEAHAFTRSNIWKQIKNVVLFFNFYYSFCIILTLLVLSSEFFFEAKVLEKYLRTKVPQMFKIFILSKIFLGHNTISTCKEFWKKVLHHTESILNSFGTYKHF